MLQYAGAWWFPWVAAFGTAINLFTLVLTAATVVLYLAAVLARPQRCAPGPRPARPRLARWHADEQEKRVASG
eukprot:scaffold45349_cov281-Isochrysis_galbana.AAC.1